MQTVPASEIKRRGLAALEGLLERGPVHVIKNNRLACVVLSAGDYENLRASGAASRRPDIWSLLLSEGRPTSDAPRSREALDAELAAERDGWDRGVLGRIERLAEVTGLSETAAVDLAVERLLREEAAPAGSGRMAALLAQIDRIPDVAEPFDPLEWDEHGLPR